MENLDEMLMKTVDTIRQAARNEDILGKPVIATDGSVIMPVNKLSYGFVVGGGEYGSAKHGESQYPYSAACGGGVTLTPLGFLICGKDKRFISVEKGEGSSKWIDLMRTISHTLKDEE